MTRENALQLATKAHTNQKRKDGKDYITHPIEVAKIAEKIFNEYAANDFLEGKENVANKIYIVGLLHDVVEDTDIGYGEISNGFPDIHIHKAIHILTRKKEQTYYDFIHHIAAYGSIIAVIVKIADLKHNMSDLKEGSLKDKYRFAHDILMNELFNRH